MRETEQEYLNFFVQDTWKVGPRLTIKPGLRYEQQKLVGNLAEFQWDGNWAPRIGVTYDPRRQRPLEDLRRVGPLLREDSERPRRARAVGRCRRDPRRLLRCGADAAGAERRAGCRTDDRTVVTAGLFPADFDDTSKSTYQDEFLVGGEYEALPGLNLGVRYVYRDMPRVLEDIGSAAMVLYSQGAPGLDSVEYFITNPS